MSPLRNLAQPGNLLGECGSIRLRPHSSLISLNKVVQHRPISYTIASFVSKRVRANDEFAMCLDVFGFWIGQKSKLPQNANDAIQILQFKFDQIQF